MNRSACTICTDVLSNDVMACPCGHVYHSNCLMTWLTVRQTCPTCRKSCGRSGIKLFFDNTQDIVATSSDIETVKANLVNEIANGKKKDLENEKLKKQVKKISKEAKQMEATLTQTNVKLVRETELKEAFKQQVTFFSANAKEADKVKERLKHVQGELDKCMRLKTMLSGTYDDVTVMLQGNNMMADELATQLAIMKREIDRTRSLRKQAMDDKERFEKQNGNLCFEAAKSEKIIKDLKSDVKVLEQENKSLKKKLENMEQAFDTSSPRSTLIKRLLHESPAPLELKRPVLSRENDENVEIVDAEGTSLFKSLPKVKMDALPSPIHPGQYMLHGKRSFMRRDPNKQASNTGRVRTGYDGLGGTASILMPSQASGRVVKKKVAKPNTISKFVRTTSKNNIL